MTLKQSIEKFAVVNNVNIARCTAREVFLKLSAEDKKTFVEHLEQQKSIRSLCEALRAEGHKISEKKIAAHRNGKCQCPKKA